MAATIAGNPERRVALVIGNGAYQENPRPTSVHDAVDVAVVLNQLGFQSMELHDATKQGMDEAIAQFTKQLGSGGVGLLYFSGQGVEVGGHNYLLPVDARLGRETDLDGQAVGLDRVLARLQESGNGLNIIILDAGRQNPFGRGGRSDQRSLALMQAHPSLLIAYAAAPGTAVEKSSERNSVYTKHLLHYLKVPGLTVEQMFKDVRVAVAHETAKKQIPWLSTTIPSEFSFTGR
jgi:uncharacterized caspase-like protein